MDRDRLVAMANQIGDFFGAEPDPSEAIASITTHLRRHWDWRMRREIMAHFDDGGEGLSLLALAAVASLKEE